MGALALLRFIGTSILFIHLSALVDVIGLLLQDGAGRLF